MKIVVARYNENVEWTKLFPNVVIFNKGARLLGNYNEQLLKNVGREGHTYYKYICDNYNNLEDFTVFLQGNPFDHSPNLVKRLRKYIKSPQLNIDFEHISEKILPCNLSRCPHHKKCELPLSTVYEKIFKEKKTEMKFQFGAGAQFIVSKQTILKRPFSFYLNIVKILEHTTNPIEGFVIERFHGLIFR